MDFRHYKVMTIRQPYAGAIAAGLIKIFTHHRQVHPRFRGELIIHAGSTRTRQTIDLPPMYREDRVRFDYYTQHYGVMLCRVRVVDIVPVEKIHPTLPALESALGDYRYGRMAWMLEDVEPLTTFVATSGQLGVWGWEMVEPIRLRSLRLMMLLR